MMNGGTFIGDGLPLFDIRKYRTGNENIITTPALGHELAKVLGNSSAVLLLGHGAVTVAPSLYSLVGRVESLKTDADIQAQAIALGGEVKYWTQTATKPQQRENRATGEGGGRGWEYWVRHVSLE
jgi:HCOMODA/2-hydroxy-3-carboxy-muconic semialdehyde decarboxylase